MKTDEDILQDVWNLIKGSKLAKSVDAMYKRTRPNNSQGTDLVISVLENHNARYQESILYVNIYVRDLNVDGTFYADNKKLKALSKNAYDALKLYDNGIFKIRVTRQDIYPQEASHSHCISTRLRYDYFNINYND